MAKQIKQPKSLGLGDTIANIIPNFLKGVDCGCEERQAKLNKLFPYKSSKCLTEKDFNYLSEFFKGDTVNLTPLTKNELNYIYLRVFNINLETQGCDSCWRDYVSHLRGVFNLY